MPKTSLAEGGNFLGSLTDVDVETIQKLGEVDMVSPFLYLSKEVEFGREKGFIQQILGFTTDNSEEKFRAYNIDIEQGRAFKEGETGVAVIGPLLANDFFDKEVRIGNKLTMKGQDFKVIGILEAVGNSEDDTALYVPMDELRELYEQGDSVSFIDVLLKDGVDIEYIAEKIHDKLERKRGDDDFSVFTP